MWTRWGGGRDGTNTPRVGVTPPEGSHQPIKKPQGLSTGGGSRVLSFQVESVRSTIYGKTMTNETSVAHQNLSWGQGHPYPGGGGGIPPLKKWFLIDG